MKILALNAGSSSLKFKIFEVRSDDRTPGALNAWVTGAISAIGHTARFECRSQKKLLAQETGSIPNHGRAVQKVLNFLKNGGFDYQAVGHRIVHGGELFHTATLIHSGTIHRMNSLSTLAPLHNPVGLATIHTTLENLAVPLPMVAVFDTSFHRTLPDHAATYAIPHDFTQRYKIRRYGFHGLAHAYLANRYQELTHSSDRECRLITLQLGHGTSAAAIRNGQSVDTTMGFTPLEGLVMGTRSGDIDPSIVPYLAEKENLPPSRIIDILNHQSGLQGISGITSNMADLLNMEKQNPRARLAVEIYCYRIRKSIGSYMAALSGIHGILFGGGIGENAWQIRERICQEMDWCGIQLDPSKNRAAKGREAEISSEASRCDLYVIPVDEESIIAKETFRTLEAAELIKHGHH